jgi:hypothetical protein
MQDPDYVLVKRWIPEYEQDKLWAHTREIRERRQNVSTRSEDKNEHVDVDHESVRKHKRKPSPSRLQTFIDGGKR